MATDILTLDELTESQASKYLTHNTALRQIEGRTIRVLSRANGGAPGSPANGDVYIVDDASGDWDSGSLNDVAHYYSSAWHFSTPSEGWCLWCNDEDVLIVFNGSAWKAYPYQNEIISIPAGAMEATAAGGGAWIDHGIGGAWELDVDESIVFSVPLGDTDRIDYTTAPKVYITWSDAATSEDITIRLQYLYRQAGESTAAAADGTVSEDLTSSGTANGETVTEMTSLDTMSSGDDLLIAKITHTDPSSPADSPPHGPIYVHGAYIVVQKSQI